MSVIWCSGVSTIQWLLSIEVNERTVGIFVSVHYILDVCHYEVSIKQGST